MKYVAITPRQAAARERAVCKSGSEQLFALGFWLSRSVDLSATPRVHALAMAWIGL